MNNQEIIARGYATDEEYKGQGSKLTKLILESKDGPNEGIWVYPLEDNKVRGQKFHFVFHNDPLSIAGPRPIAGMVGIATSNGPDQRATALTSDCYPLFKKAGKAAIDYSKTPKSKKKGQKA
jgi:hypothetical protein